MRGRITPSPPAPSAISYALIHSLLSSLTTSASTQFASLNAFTHHTPISTTHADNAIAEARRLFPHSSTPAELSQLKTHLYNMYRKVRASAISQHQKTDLLRQIDTIDAQIVAELNSGSSS